MILPQSPSIFPVKGPSEIDARAVIGTPFQVMAQDLSLLDSLGGPIAAYENIRADNTGILFALTNPGLSYLDLAVFSDAALAGVNVVKAYGVIDIPGGKFNPPRVEAQFDPTKDQFLVNFPSIAQMHGVLIVPLYDPDTGLQPVSFSATPDILDTTSVATKTYAVTSGNNYVYCAGVSRVFAVRTSGGDSGVLMGRFVG